MDLCYNPVLKKFGYCTSNTVSSNFVFKKITSSGSSSKYTYIATQYIITGLSDLITDSLPKNTVLISNDELINNTDNGRLSCYIHFNTTDPDIYLATDDTYSNCRKIFPGTLNYNIVDNVVNFSFSGQWNRMCICGPTYGDEYTIHITSFDLCLVSPSQITKSVSYTDWSEVVLN